MKKEMEQCIPRCSTCRSTNVKCLTTLNRAISIGILEYYLEKLARNMSVVIARQGGDMLFPPTTFGCDTSLSIELQIKALTYYIECGEVLIFKFAK